MVIYFDTFLVAGNMDMEKIYNSFKLLNLEKEEREFLKTNKLNPTSPKCNVEFPKTGT